MMPLLRMNMTETKIRENNPKKRYLITKGELPESAGGGKATIKEKIVFTAIVIVVIVVIVVAFKLV